MSTTNAPKNDRKLEVIVIPVADVDRAKDFDSRLGWRLDAEFASGGDFRILQFTPPGSSCSIDGNGAAYLAAEQSGAERPA
jgi:catechol 2,3-dioxygenase-like lactoylglutathione lyase family enzyme